MKTKLKKQLGFTIIEVLIVLAIAGLILLVVFLAVPALQRNARNTQRRNDVAVILGAVAEFANSNNGNLVTACNAPSAGTVVFTGAAGTNSSEARVGYYNQLASGACPAVGSPVKGEVSVGSTLTNITTPSGATDYLLIETGQTCNSANSAAVAGSQRSIAAVYEVENGSNSYVESCQSS